MKPPFFNRSLQRNAMPPHSHGLDTLRAFAVLAVMLYHLTIFGELPTRLLPVARFGWMGVDLFFVLSGFLIGQQVCKPYLCGQRPAIGGFYSRRAYRILPAYLAVLALYLFVPWWREAPRLAPLWKFLTFTMNLGFDFDRRAFSHAWSLCVEEHFYLLLPLVAALLARRPSARKIGATLIFLVLFGIALRALLLARYPDEVYTRIYYPSYTRLDGLLAGVALALARLLRPAWWARLMRHGHLLSLSGAACVAAVMLLFWQNELGSSDGLARWGTIFGFPLLALGLALVTASSVSLHGLLARVRVPFARTLAALAFALYLTHKPVAHAVMLACPRITAPKGPASWLLYGFACLAAAGLLHLTVELPFLRLRDRTAARKRLEKMEAVALEEPAL